ncbi:peptide deformylase [Rickettsia endosymbiont of Polydrusus tereticollis]|uniref:peptide deformylase n=1 Tax=Rickettsia endosymbiont of Polydrusus tereticollis TaxID=3066251 RepID=UPI0031333BF7
MNSNLSFFSIIYAPNEIFKKQAEYIDVVDDNIRIIIDKMLKTMQIEKAVGLGANMVGILKRIAIVDLYENNKSSPIILINPEIIYFSEEKQSFMERSLSFPGIDANITRSKTIKVKYLDYEGNKQELNAEGFLATVIQHEVDYLNGKVFLDYLSKLKRDTLLKKMGKHLKLHPPHIHSAGCRH